MIQRKTSNIDIGCDRCERSILTGTAFLEVDEITKICVFCGFECRDEWCAFFESLDAETPEDMGVTSE